MTDQSAIRDSDVIDGLTVRYLKLLGIWKVINDFRTKKRKNVILKVQVLMTLLLTVPSIISQYVGLMVIEVDIEKATILNFHSLPAMHTLCRHLVFWFNIESLCRLFNLMKKDFLETTVEREKVEFIYKKMSNLINKTCYLLCFLLIFAASFLVLSPGISVDYLMYHTGDPFKITTGRKKISTGWYPVPMDRSPWYELVVLYEGFLVMWCGVFISLFTCFYYQLLMCLNAHFTVLGSHVSSLRINYDYNKNSIQYKIINEQIYSEMYSILKNHQKLLSFADELSSVYNPLVTLILGIGTFILIISVFQFLMGQTGDPIFVSRSIIYLIYESTEVILFCYGSSIIESASSDLHFAIYESDWYKADIKFRKAAQMLMMRSKKGVTLTAIRIYPVNLETIMSILNFTYTVATLLLRFK